jgi:prolyl-tRNA editing enzyme YbaK/EbsC (Cys-tRNA(Pro) deacylase)
MGIIEQVNKMISKEIQQYSDTLNTLKIGHEIVEHPELKTPPEVCKHLGITLADGISTMIMKAEDKYIAVIRRDDCRVDFKKIKQLTGKNVRMASPEEFTTLTGLPLGAARVYNPGLITYLDDKIFEKEHLIGGSGSFTCSIRYSAQGLKNIPASTVVSVSQ